MGGGKPHARAINDPLAQFGLLIELQPGIRRESRCALDNARILLDVSATR